MKTEKLKNFWNHGLNPIVGFRIKQNMFVPIKEKRKAKWPTK